MAGVMITSRLIPATVARLNRFAIIVITGAIVPMKRHYDCDVDAWNVTLTPRQCFSNYSPPFNLFAIAILSGFSQWESEVRIV